MNMRTMDQRTTAGKPNIMRRQDFIQRFLLPGIFFLSCATAGKLDRCRPILGLWQTQKGVIMSLSLAPDNTVNAAVKAAPGFLEEDIQKTERLISDIHPLVDGRFEGRFLMPEGIRPLNVILALTDGNTLLIMTRDGRARGAGLMRWTRVENLPDELK